MSSESSPSLTNAFTVDVVSAEDIKKRARTPRSSGLTSSLAKEISRSISLPSSASTPSTFDCTNGEVLEDTNSRLIPESIVEVDEVAEEVSPSSRPIVRRPRKINNLDPSEISTADSPETDWRLQPPHILSLPSFQGKKFSDNGHPGSLYVGVGRKLRGFDAERFRQSVMQQTGFLETAQL